MSIQGGGGYQSPWSSQTGLTELDGAMGELEPLGELTEVGFEPQTRARSNTWPLPRPDNYVEPADDAGSKKNSNQNLTGKYHLSSLIAGSHLRYRRRLFRSLRPNSFVYATNNEPTLEKSCYQSVDKGNEKLPTCSYGIV